MLFGPAIRNIQVRYYVDHDNDHRRATFIAGMGRSGTTWLAQLLNFRNDSRFMFEPFDPGRVAMSVNFTDHTYLRRDDVRRTYLAPARAIVTGLVREWFVDQHNRKVICPRRIIKDVRVNLFLRWLYEQFPGMPLVLIVRHPFAIAASRAKTGADVDLETQFLAQPQLVEDYLAPFADLMRRCQTPFERHVAAWCVEIGIPLSQFKTGELGVVFYEQLAAQPLVVLPEIFAHIGRRFDRRVADFVKKPSHTTLSKSTLTTAWASGSSRVTSAWQASISPVQVRRGLDILEAFGLSDVYDDSPMPKLLRPPLGLTWRSEPASRENMVSPQPS